jgi:hypothetical protein
VAALARSRRQHAQDKADALRAVLRAPALRQPPVTQCAYASVVTAQVAVIAALNGQVAPLGHALGEHLDRHPDVQI